MARDTFEEWIADENSSEVIQALMENSAVETYARPEPMSTAVKNVPRDGGFTVGNVAKGGTYGESVSDDDTVEIVARKVAGTARIAEEDLSDPYVDVLKTKRLAAVCALAINYDNSSLAVTGAQNGTTIKYTSVYKSLRTNGTTGPTSTYVADANYDSVTAANFVAALSAGTGYNALNDVVGYVEEGDFFDEANTIIIASPRFRKLLRGVKDVDGNPMLVPRAGSGLARPQYDIFGYPTFWSMGCRTSAVDSQAPTGNPLLLVANRDRLISGQRGMADQIPPNQPFALQRAKVGIGFQTDEAIFKAAIRRGFALGIPFAAAALEILP